MIDPEDLENQLQEALKECASLREENERLKKLLGLYPEDIAQHPNQGYQSHPRLHLSKSSYE